jgi:glyoxylase-like metal-dependent hydrolase (beta-lactamase superfamily II)
MEFNRSRRVFTLSGAAALLLAACATTEQDAQPVLLRSEQAMGGAQLRTLRYAGSGTGATFGQAWQAGFAWPRLNYPSFAREIDYDNGAMREEFARNRAEPSGGGAVPLMGTGDQRSVALVRGEYAWNMAGTSATAAPLAVTDRMHDLWITPHGVVKAALRNQATVRSEGPLSVVTFSERGRFRAVAWINAAGLVERVESVLPNPVLGDTRVVTRYLAYRDFGGVMFPTRIEQKQGGFPVLELDVSQVQPNAPVAIAVPAAVQSATERVTVEKAADGVWFLSGGSHNSVLIEMKDHLILVESPLWDGRAQAVLEEVRTLAPGKPLRYVINSHHHFDHSGGLRTAVAQGATLVTSEQSRGWFEQVLANPNTIRPDAMASSGRKAVITGVSTGRTFTDGERTVRVHMVDDSVHAHGFMMVWLPRERLLIEADAFTPGPPNAPPPAQVNANNLNLVNNIERLKLDVERILPLHGRMVPASQLYAAVGR